eukprot:2482087-Amphidinium_carterae.1
MKSLSRASCTSSVMYPWASSGLKQVSVWLSLPLLQSWQSSSLIRHPIAALSVDHLARLVPSKGGCWAQCAGRLCAQPWLSI